MNKYIGEIKDKIKLNNLDNEAIVSLNMKLYWSVRENSSSMLQQNNEPHNKLLEEIASAIKEFSPIIRESLKTDMLSSLPKTDSTESNNTLAEVAYSQKESYSPIKTNIMESTSTYNSLENEFELNVYDSPPEDNTDKS